MYETFEDAKKAALDVIGRLYGGNKMGCVVVERVHTYSNNPQNARNTRRWYGFRFHGSDTNGDFEKFSGYEWERRTLI